MAQTRARTPTEEAASPAAFRPYVPASESPAEFTLRAVMLGAFFGLIFGASTVYLGLRAGLTVSAPADANVAPPGHYMLFVLNGAGVPSVGVQP